MNTTKADQTIDRLAAKYRSGDFRDYGPEDQRLFHRAVRVLSDDADDRQRALERFEAAVD